VEPKALNLLAEEGFDPEYGARPVRRVIQERLEAEIAEHILKGIFRKGDTIRVVQKDKDTLDFLPAGKAVTEPQPQEQEQEVAA
jgi:ATP-dependent Clp protease ATP-binding subunit ClpA